MINAIVMIHAESARIPETAQAVADLSGDRGLLVRR